MKLIETYVRKNHPNDIVITVDNMGKHMAILKKLGMIEDVDFIGISKDRADRKDDVVVFVKYTKDIDSAKKLLHKIPCKIWAALWKNGEYIAEND